MWRCATKLMNTVFWRRLNRFWCQLTHVIHRTRALNDQLWGHGLKVKVTRGGRGLVEAGSILDRFVSTRFHVVIWCTDIYFWNVVMHVGLHVWLGVWLFDYWCCGDVMIYCINKGICFICYAVWVGQISFIVRQILSEDNDTALMIQ